MCPDVGIPLLGATGEKISNSIFSHGKAKGLYTPPYQERRLQCLRVRLPKDSRLAPRDGAER